MNALERLRALKNSGMRATPALTELTKAPSVSFVSASRCVHRDISPPAVPRRDASAFLAGLAALLGTTPENLLGSGVILPEELSDYLDRDPQAISEAIRRAYPNRFPVLTAADDDRRHCSACVKLAGRRCTALGTLVIDRPPRRCLHYQPSHTDTDQRTGRERWARLATSEATEDNT